MRPVLLVLCLFWQCASEAEALAPDFSLPFLSSPGPSASVSVEPKSSEAVSAVPDMGRALSDYRGKVVYVDFWASWCGVCQQSLPALDRLQKKLDQDLGLGRFVVLAVNLDTEPDAGRQFLKRVPVSYVVLSDKHGVTPQAYGLSTLPASVLVNVDGRVVAELTGYRESDLLRLEKAIRVLLAP